MLLSLSIFIEHKALNSGQISLFAHFKVLKMWHLKPLQPQYFKSLPYLNPSMSHSLHRVHLTWMWLLIRQARVQCSLESHSPSCYEGHFLPISIQQGCIRRIMMLAPNPLVGLFVPVLFFPVITYAVWEITPWIWPVYYKP